MWSTGQETYKEDWSDNNMPLGDHVGRRNKQRESMWNRIREEHMAAREHVLEYLSTLDSTISLIDEARKCAMDSRVWLERYKSLRESSKGAERHIAEAGQLVLLEAAIEENKSVYASTLKEKPKV